MAFDKGMAQILRDALAEYEGVTEKRMFGGLCFMLQGNMLCGVHEKGCMFRVGKENEEYALSLQGARPMDFTGRKMGGMVSVADDVVIDDQTCGKILGLALEFVGNLPQK